VRVCAARLGALSFNRLREILADLDLLLEPRDVEEVESLPPNKEPPCN